MAGGAVRSRCGRILWKEPEHEVYRHRKDNAENDAGHDRKEKRETGSMERNVARKATDEGDPGNEQHSCSNRRNRKAED